MLLEVARELVTLTLRGQNSIITITSELVLHSCDLYLGKLQRGKLSISIIKKQSERDWLDLVQRKTKIPGTRTQWLSNTEKCIRCPYIVGNTLFCVCVSVGLWRHLQVSGFPTHCCHFYWLRRPEVQRASGMHHGWLLLAQTPVSQANRPNIILLFNL